MATLQEKSDAVAKAASIDSLEPSEKAGNIGVQSVHGKEDERPLTWWEKVEEVVWDGGNRTREEKRIVQRLDLFLM
jgi:hypothetical protein